jgi:hypothetical protein
LQHVGSWVSVLLIVYFTAVLTGCHVMTALAGEPVMLSPDGGVASLMTVTVVRSGGGVRICDRSVAGHPAMRAAVATIRMAEGETRILASSLWKWMRALSCFRPGF